MTTAERGTWTRRERELAGIQVSVETGGEGEPLLVFHDETGHPGPLRWHDALARDFAVSIPMMPGCGGSARLDWAMSMRDVAGWYLEALDDMDVGAVNAVGFSLGGWLAAEMATMNPERFRKLALVSAAGVRPPTGEIMDMFLVTMPVFLDACVRDKSAAAEFPIISPEEPSPDLIADWEDIREIACMIGWRPYMHNPNLPRLLHRLKRTPTLIVWGREDAVIPLSAGQKYNESIPNSRLVALEGCGHMPAIEKPDEFAAILRDFFKG